MIQACIENFDDCGMPLRIGDIASIADHVTGGSVHRIRSRLVVLNSSGEIVIELRNCNALFAYYHSVTQVAWREGVGFVRRREFFEYQKVHVRPAENIGQFSIDQERELVEGFIRDRIEANGFDPDSDVVMFRSSEAAKWLSSCLGRNLSANHSSRRIGTFRIPEIKPFATAHFRGFIWVGRDSNPSDRYRRDREVF